MVALNTEVSGQKSAVSRATVYIELEDRERRLRAAIVFAEERSRIKTSRAAVEAAEELKNSTSRYKFATLLHTLDNQTCGISEDEVPLWHYAFIKGVEENWPKFWARRGMTPPPISHHIVHAASDDENFSDSTTNRHE